MIPLYQSSDLFLSIHQTHSVNSRSESFHPTGLSFLPLSLFCISLLPFLLHTTFHKYFQPKGLIQKMGILCFSIEFLSIICRVISKYFIFLIFSMWFPSDINCESIAGSLRTPLPHFHGCGTSSEEAKRKSWFAFIIYEHMLILLSILY